jgi:hypothetical protein
MPSNENLSFQPITKNLGKLVLYFVVNAVHKTWNKTKSKYKRNGICGLVLTIQNVVCTESFKQ